MKIKDLISHLESIAPPVYQESYDNAGLIVGNPSEMLNGVLLCLDSTEAVIDEAIEKGCNLVIAHHPIVFFGLKRFNGSNYVERTVMKAIKNDIAIYAAHTNLDNVYNGVNAKISERLGLTNKHILLPKNEPGVDEDPARVIGSGMIGTLEQPMKEKAFLQLLKDRMQASVVKHTQLLGKPISKVAVCGGAGGFLLKHAIREGAQIFITSDYKYHEFFDADGKIIIADIGHFESEQFTIQLFEELIREKFSTFAVRLTEVNTNPVSYF
ncbi:MAG: Nif3-like dinuclear metal center hexameric protein [Bacteroidota bacterium]